MLSLLPIRTLGVRASLCAPRHCTYVQGQSPQPRVREYFYYVDHNGQLFLDDARFKNFTSCFKDVPFLDFFFSRLQINRTGRYQDRFPYFSLCGTERNFLRCDDKPLVFVDLKQDSERNWYLLYGSERTTKLRILFRPEHLYQCPVSGRVYHPTNREPASLVNAVELAFSIGLVSSKLTIQLSPNFQRVGDASDVTPTMFHWDGKSYKLSGLLESRLQALV